LLPDLSLYSSLVELLALLWADGTFDIFSLRFTVQGEWATE
jgi:hypothetical protein